MKKLNKKPISRILLLGSLAPLFFSSSMAFADPVDVTSGICEDSTCARRDLSLVVKARSSSSANSVSTASYSGPGATYHPPGPSPDPNPDPSPIQDNCVERSDYREAQCPSPQIGGIVEARDYKCTSQPTGAWSSWYQTLKNCTNPTPPPVMFPSEPTPPVTPNCTAADNIDPAFYNTSDEVIIFDPEPSWPSNFCDGVFGQYTGASPVSGAVGSIYQCESGYKVKKVLAIDGSCQYNWSLVSLWSTTIVDGGVAMQNAINRFKLRHPEAI